MCSSGGGGASPSCDVNTLEADCDGDGITNEDELVCLTDPNDSASKPENATDCDGDGVTNEGELGCGTDPNDPTSRSVNLTDNDNDGFCNEVDVDDDNDGLIEIQTVAQLHAMRTDLDGDGRTDAGVSADPNLLGDTGCLDNACKGYELGQSLNFDENGDGEENDTYNQKNSTWQWNFFEGTDTFTCLFEDSINNFPIAAWSFMNACNDGDGNILHGILGQDSFNNCDGLFVGGVTDSQPSNTDLHRSEVSIDRSKLPLSSFFSPSTPRINCSHLGNTIFNYDFSVFSDFPLFSEICEDLTDQTGAKTNSLYSINTAPCDTSTYKVNRFRGIFERNGFEIKWK